MIFPGCTNLKECPNVNTELLKLEGYLDEEEAKITLAKFLRNNLTWTVEFATGKKLFPMQQILISGMMTKDFYLAIAGRGLSKTFSAAMFCWLYAIFYPGVRIGILAPTFRQSRILFEFIESFAKSKQGEILQQCFVGSVSHKNEVWKMTIGKSEILALPLGEGSKLRGLRFNVILVDELLLMPERVINEIILPFLAVNFDPVKMKETVEEEDKLIKAGVMTDLERTIFQKPKFIGLSSASYSFEFLYKLYKEYVDKIYDPNPKNELGEPVDTSGYGVMQLSYQVAPKFLYSEEAIIKMKAQMSEAQFNREFGSRFTDDSGGYFSKKKMDLCTVPNGQEPTIEIVGKPLKKYILSIDPSWSNSQSSDHFAMGIFSIDEEEEKLTLVHNYAVSGGSFQDHLNYLLYILKNFNIVYLIVDSTGSGNWFLQDANASALFVENKINLLEFNADFENANYEQGLRNARLTYSKENNRIYHGQVFSNDWITKANERLAAMLDHRSIRFASQAMDSKFESLMKYDIPINDLVFDIESKNLEGAARKAEFIECQGELINLVKSETCLIEVSVTDTGKLTFKLPQNIKRDTSPTRARRDSYTALLLGSWGYKCYKDMTGAVEEEVSFIPFFAA